MAKETEVTTMAKVIAEQEKKIEQLTTSIEHWKKEYEEYKRLYKELYAANKEYEKKLKEATDTHTIDLLKTSLQVALTANKDLHARCDAAFAGAAIDADARRHLLIDITKRLAGIEKTVSAYVEEDRAARIDAGKQRGGDANA